MKVQRLDIGRMDAPSRTPQGGLRVPASLTRSGVFIYTRADGTEVREFRPDEEVFNADSLATLPGAPVTENHPSVPVRADNFREFAKGHVGDNVIKNGERVGATLYVQDGTLVSAIERGDMREVSCGYTCDIDETAGVTSSGERYDRVQRGISYNHVAIVHKGRAGAEVRLHLDASENTLPPQGEKEPTMEFERIDGVKYEVGSEAHKAATERHEANAKAAKAEGEKLQARCDAAEAEAKKLKAEIAELPAKITEQARARAGLESGAKSVLGADIKLDAMTDAEIKLAVARKANPELKLEGKSDAYVEALYDLAIVAKPESDLATAIRATESATRGDSDDIDDEKVRLDSLKATAEAWKKPLASSKELA